MSMSKYLVVEAWTWVIFIDHAIGYMLMARHHETFDNHSLNTSWPRIRETGVDKLLDICDWLELRPVGCFLWYLPIPHWLIEVIYCVLAISPIDILTWVVGGQSISWWVVYFSHMLYNHQLCVPSMWAVYEPSTWIIFYLFVLCTPFLTW